MQRVAIAVLMMAVMTACGGGGTDGPVAPTPPPANSGVSTVTVSVSPSQITVGATASATAELRSGAGAVLTGRSVDWSSSAPAIASVNSAGVVSAIAAGSATITGTSEGKSGSAPITVAPAPVATVTITLALPTLTLGATTTAFAVLRDERGATLTGRAITWSSTSPSVAAVSNDGAITTLAVGTTTITASSEGKSASATLTVLPVPVATVTVALGATSLVVGATTSATAVLRSANGAALSGRAVMWSSSVPSVAVIDANGAITSVSVGTATITATSEGISGSATVTVIPAPVASITLSAPQSSLTIGSSTQVTAVTRAANGQVLADRAIAWSTSAPSVASVSSTGVILALAPGGATITAASEGRTATFAVSVLAPTPAMVNVSPATVTLAPSQSANLTVTVRDASGNVMTGQSVLWSSSANGVATVTQTGVVTAVAPGVVVITAASGGRSATAAVTVQSAVVAAVSLNFSTATMLAGDIRVLVATARDASDNILSGRAVSWTSSNLSIVEGYVFGDTAVITGLRAGSATVTATIDGRSASALVNVLVPASSICTIIAGASVYGDDNEYLGRFTNRFDSQSVLNEFGAYGSPYRSTSTNNNYGTYGSPYSSLSARNPYASRPPRIIKNGAFLAYYTTNSSRTPAVSPAYALTCPFP